MSNTLRIGALALGIAASFVMAQSADAGTLTLTRNTTDANGFTGNIGGGEFGINITSGSGFATAPAPMKISSYDFQTFCVEGGQDLSGGQPFTYTSGLAVNGTGTPLNSKVAFLYTIFYYGASSFGFNETGQSMLADGSGLDGSSGSAQHFFNYNYTPGVGRKSSAEDLQEAIWFLMGQWQGAFSGLTTQAREMVNLAYISTSTPTGLWFNYLGANSTGAVRILSLTSTAGVPQQDVLALLETGTPQVFITPVPLPSSALMGLGLMAGLGAVGLVRRRRQTLA